MQFPDLGQEKDILTAAFSREYSIPLGDIRVVASPYRISPLGAHIDHQGGPVLGALTLFRTGGRGESKGADP